MVVERTRPPDAMALVLLNDADGLACRMIELLQQPQQAAPWEPLGGQIEHRRPHQGYEEYERLFDASKS